MDHSYIQSYIVIFRLAIVPDFFRRDLKTSKPSKSNLTFNQRKGLQEIKSDEVTSIYPYDKGEGLFRINKQNAIQNIEEQIGNTKIILILHNLRFYLIKQTAKICSAEKLRGGEYYVIEIKESPSLCY